MARLRAIWRTLRYLLRRSTAPRGTRQKLVLLAGVALIVTWQWGFALSDAKLDETYRNTAASGMHNDAYFVYFLWYENLFPVVSQAAFTPCDFRCAPTQESMAPAALSQEAANGVVNGQGKTLLMDSGWTWYAGDRGKVFLYLLDAWLKGVPWRPSVKPFHRLAWITSLCGLFYAFWRIRRPAFGASVVLFLGSDPFQLYEVNGHDNVFGWSITAAVMLLAIHLPLLTGRRADRRWVFVWPIATALLMATIRTFRSEPMPMLVGAVYAYVTVRFTGVETGARTWLRRGALIVTMAAVFLLTGQLWNRYFLRKQDQAARVVASKGGHPYPGNVRMYHHFWHPVWCGLGDFDTKYGYVWDDTKAIAFARPILQQKFGEYVPSTNFFDPRKNLDEYWDAGGHYKKLPYDIQNYNEVIEDKVLSDIRRDPRWYAEILYHRIERMILEASPIRLSYRKGWLDVPLVSAKLFPPVLLLLALVRARFATRLLIFTLPTLTTGLVVYCAKGIQWYGIFHLFMAAVLLLTGYEAVRSLIRRKVRGARAS